MQSVGVNELSDLGSSGRCEADQQQLVIKEWARRSKLRRFARMSAPLSRFTAPPPPSILDEIRARAGPFILAATRARRSASGRKTLESSGAWT